MSGMNRPSPYNRSERFGMGMGTGMRRGMGSMGQSGRNLKGKFIEDLIIEFIRLGKAIKCKTFRAFNVFSQQKSDSEYLNRQINRERAAL